MHRVLMNYQKHGAYTCHFIEADCKTAIGRRTRFIDFATLDELVAFYHRCNPDDPDELRTDMRRWGKGSSYVSLTDDQCAKLKEG